MGLSLRKIGDFIGGAISGGAKDVGHFASGVERQVNPFDNGATFSNPQGNGQQQSVVQQATPLVKGIVHPFSTFGSAILHVPEAVGLELQNKPISPVQQHVFGTTDPTNIAKQIIGDTATVGLTAAAPGLGKIIEGGVAKALPGVTNTVLPKVAANAALGGTFNATNTAAQGGDLGQTTKAFRVGAELGGAAPLVSEAVKPVVRVAQTGIENRVPLNSGGYAQLPFREPGETEVPQIAQQYAQEYTPQQLIQQHADFLKNHESGLKGGQIVDRTGPNEPVGSGYRRTTEHSTFYREYYAANKRPPSNAAWLDQATQELEAGHGQLLDPGFKDAYDLAKLHESANAGIANNPSPTEPSVPLKTTTPSVKPNVKLKQVGQGSVQKANLTPEGNVPFDTKDIAVLNKRLAAGSDTPEVALGDLPPSEQMAKYRQDNPQLFQEKVPQEINTAKNPFKSEIPEVQPGDYKQVISNEQAASNPVQFAGQRWVDTMKKLSPDEQANFWRAVEKPNGNYSSELNQAISAWRNVDNRIHGTSQTLGGNTNYLQNHNLHPWNLPAEFTDHIANGGNPESFPGLRSISRKYSTIAEGEKAGLTLGNDPVNEGLGYINASSALLKRRAIVKGLQEADGLNPDKSHAFDIGGGNSIPVSAEAKNAVRGLVRSAPSDNKVIKGARTVNAGLKSSILSLGQFHPINISALRAAPTLALKGHPVRAAVGLSKTFRVLAPGGNEVVQKTLQKALDDGMVDKAAKIGMPYGAGGFDTEGSLLKGGVGHHTVFEKQMPMIHDQVVRSVVADLEKKGIPLDNPEARAAGKAGNNLMGFVNKEAQNIPPQVNRSLGDFLLAKQFTHSKFSQLKTAVTARPGSVAGSYARANIAANVAATTAIITGIGYIAGQKSDNVKDLLLRALIDPAAPTNTKDSKGNTIKLRTPGTDTSDLAKLLGIKLVRNADGHLGISWKPGNAPSTVTDFARSRLSPLLSSGVKLATNTTFANKPLYDPSAPAGVKAEQAGTSLVTGLLPIGAQGLPMVNAIEKHLPGNVQDVLNAQKPGANPLVKSIGSSFGLTPTTDTTVGKGLQTTRYFSALDTAKSGLNAKEKDALDIYAGSKKNPVTNKYDVQPNVNDTVTKARALLDQPKVIDHLISMNSQLNKQGQKVDPLWLSSKDQITKVLQYQAMPPGGADRTHWEAQNGDWYNKLADSRSAFFNSLPSGDPNKPQAPIAYPTPTPDVAAAQKQFFSITDSKERAQFLQDHPEVQTQLDAQVDYNNKLREAQGYSALDKFPTASPDVEKIINEYNSVPKGGGKKGGNLYRSQWITSHPDAYKAMSDYYTQASLYGLQHEAGQAQFADTGASQKLLKDAYNLGKYDIVKNKDGTYALGSSYSSSGSGGSGGSGGYSRSGVGGGRYVSRTAAELQNPYFNALDISAGGKRTLGKAKKPKVTKSTGGGFKVKPQGYQPKSVSAVLPSKMKVKLKASKV